MPTYKFFNKNTNEEFEDFMSISQLEKIAKSNNTALTEDYKKELKKNKMEQLLARVTGSKYGK